MKVKHVEETREELLKRATEARALRRQAKKEARATLVIQKHARAMLELQKLQKVEQEAWDRSFANTKGDDIDARGQLRMVARLLFIQDKTTTRTDAQQSSLAMNISRARVAVGLILQGISSRNPRVHFCALALMDDQRDLTLFLHVFLRFIAHCSRLAKAQRDRCGTPDLLLETGTLKLLTDVLNEENWRCCKQEWGITSVKEEEKDQQVQMAIHKLRDGLCTPVLFSLLHTVLLLEEEIKGKYNTASTATGPAKLATSFCNKLLCTIIESREARWLDL
jgi:hypothetical protein